jgi:hypothetical protein
MIRKYFRDMLELAFLLTVPPNRPKARAKGESKGKQQFAEFEEPLLTILDWSWDGVVRPAGEYHFTQTASTKVIESLKVVEGSEFNEKSTGDVFLIIISVHESTRILHPGLWIHTWHGLFSPENAVTEQRVLLIIDD